jgi:hypothetical protein
MTYNCISGVRVVAATALLAPRATGSSSNRQQQQQQQQQQLQAAEELDSNGIGFRFKRKKIKRHGITEKVFQKNR